MAGVHKLDVVKARTQHERAPWYLSFFFCAGKKNVLKNKTTSVNYKTLKNVIN